MEDRIERSLERVARLQRRWGFTTYKEPEEVARRAYRCPLHAIDEREYYKCDDCLEVINALDLPGNPDYYEMPRHYRDYPMNGACRDSDARAD